jgi:hypothetical protein
MSSQVMVLISLVALRVGIPLLVTLVVSMLLSQWDSRRGEFLAR